MNTFNVGILGATGAVGQKFIKLLRSHPWFTVTTLGASKRSAGKPYKQAVHWIEDIAIPEQVAGLDVDKCDPRHFADVDFVFSGLDSSVAGDIERNFAEAGIPVISNAKNYRLDDQIPLLIPEVNPDHTKLIEHQSFTSDQSGWIVTNPNCVTVPLAMALKPLADSFGIDSVMITAMQSISGAGYPGVSAMDLLGNIVPYISGEEPKAQPEATKILGRLNVSKIESQSFPVQATCVRVPTIAGHLLSVSVGLEDSSASIDGIKQLLTEWNSPIAELDLPSSPEQPLKVYNTSRYPQPRLHASREGGMQTAIGRLREDQVMDVAFVTMAHNTVRGAAGGAILNAELLAEKGYL